MKFVRVVLLVWVALGWVGFGLVAAGGERADLREMLHWHDNVRCRRDAGFSLAIGVAGGPLSLVATSLMTGLFAAGWESPFAASFWNCGTS